VDPAEVWPCCIRLPSPEKVLLGTLVQNQCTCAFLGESAAGQWVLPMVVVVPGPVTVMAGLLLRVRMLELKV